MAPQTSSETDRITRLQEYALLLAKSGMSYDAIRQQLLAYDATPEIADQIIQVLCTAAKQPRKVKPGDERKQARKQGTREFGCSNMVIGVVICAVGILITVVTYRGASGGGVYIVAYGPIIFGAAQFLIGLSRFTTGED